MRFLLLVCLCIAAVASASSYEEVKVYQGDMLKGFSLEDLASFPSAAARLRSTFRSFISKAKDWVNSFVFDAGHSKTEDVAANPNPYFGFIPYIAANIVPGAPVTWSAPCFKESVGSAVMDGDILRVNVSVSKGGLLCNEFYLFGTTQAIAFHEFSSASTAVLAFNLSASTDSQKWDIMNNGIRVLRFNKGMADTLDDVAATINLFVSEATKGVPAEVEKANIDFLRKYEVRPYTARPAGSDIIINETDIHSGDAFFITRLDGLDPMLVWATGGSGHSTMALWMGGELYVVESTVKDSYWPTDGIQKTPYRTWIAQAQAADYNVVYLPLSEESRAKFDEAAATAFFLQNEGYAYGIYNFLFGWIDTLKDNYPCVPPYPSSQCLQFEMVPVLFGVLGQVAPPLFDEIAGQALGHRVSGVVNNMADVLKAAHDQGIDPFTLPTIVEQDSWKYKTTRFGKPMPGSSMVCSVFVCALWKASNLFGTNDINCGEFHPGDDTGLAIFQSDPLKLPAACEGTHAADQPCQMMGKYDIPLVAYNSRPVGPHISEKCATMAPDYVRSPGC